MLSARARTAVSRSRFGLRGRGRRGARFLPGLAGPMGKRAPADRDPVPLPRSGHAEHTNGKAHYDGVIKVTDVIEDADAPADVAAGVLRLGADHSPGLVRAGQECSRGLLCWRLGPS